MLSNEFVKHCLQLSEAQWILLATFFSQSWCCNLTHILVLALSVQLLQSLQNIRLTCDLWPCMGQCLVWCVRFMYCVSWLAIVKSMWIIWLPSLPDFLSDYNLIPTQCPNQGTSLQGPWILYFLLFPKHNQFFHMCCSSFC